MPSLDPVAVAMPPSPSLREAALAALCMRDPLEKAAAAHGLWATLTALPDGPARAGALAPAADIAAPALALPGRPPRPELRPPTEVPHRSPFTPEGLAALLHAVCHIEFNAIKSLFN